MSIEKNVAVMMSFGGNDAERQRLSKLHFLRLKQLIEHNINVQVVPGEPESKVRYTVKHARTDVGNIPDQALRVILNADVLIGLITEVNVNVIYELAVRNLLKGALILLVDGDPKEKSFLPIYMEDMAYIRYDKLTHPELLSYLQATARETFTELNFDGVVPEPLKNAVQRQDQELQQALESAFSHIETNPNTPPGGVTFVKDLDPGRNLSSWYTFYPYNVVRIGWRKIGENNRYDANDMIGQPVIYAANDRFFQMFNIATDAETFDPEAETLTLLSLANKLKADESVYPENLSAWTKDQERLANQIIFKNGFARAKTPLQFNETHANQEFQNRAYFPSLVAKRIVGDKRRPHTVYLLVVFIELPEVRDVSERSKSAGNLSYNAAA